MSAHWVFIEYETAICSGCGNDIGTPFETTKEACENWDSLYPFCPHCGAKMERGGSKREREKLLKKWEAEERRLERLAKKGGVK